MDLNGISAIVTGGASGLGEATVRLLAERGARCVVVDMNPDKGEAVAKDVNGVFVQADVANPDQVIEAVEAAKDLGPLRALVTAAGVGWATRTIGRDGEYASAHDLDIFKKVIEVNRSAPSTASVWPPPPWARTSRWPTTRRAPS